MKKDTCNDLEIYIASGLNNQTAETVPHVREKKSIVYLSPLPSSKQKSKGKGRCDRAKCSTHSSAFCNTQREREIRIGIVNTRVWIECNRGEKTSLPTFWDPMRFVI